MFNLAAGWIFMTAFYVMFMRGYSTVDIERIARLEYRHRVGNRFGLLPPSSEPIGMLLWIATALGFVAAIGFFLTDGDYVGASSGTMVGTFLVTLWRDDRWTKQQPDYQEAVDVLRAERNGRKPDQADDGDYDKH